MQIGPEQPATVLVAAPADLEPAAPEPATAGDAVDSTPEPVAV